MRIHQLKRLPGTSTWTWRTVEGNKGTYLTFANGKGILYNQDDGMYGRKFCTHEKFSVCKTVSGTRRKLNRIFAPLADDPSPDNDYRI